MKRPKPLYASKPRFGLGSLAALVFVAAFGIAAIMFGINALSSNTRAAAPVQPAVTLDATSANNALPTDAAPAAATQAPIDAQTAQPTLAPTEAPIEAAPAVAATEAIVATAITEPTLAPSPTPAAQPGPTAEPTQTPAATETAAATSAPIGTGETVTYTVKGGDTCGAISRELGVSVAQIIEQNKLDSRCFLNVGKVLTITK